MYPLLREGRCLVNYLCLTQRAESTTLQLAPTVTAKQVSPFRINITEIKFYWKQNTVKKNPTQPLLHQQLASQLVLKEICANVGHCKDVLKQ